MTTGPDTSDNDYGYDLAHEVEQALRMPTARPKPRSAPMGTGRPVDPDDDDLGYADAHDGMAPPAEPGGS